MTGAREPGDQRQQKPRRRIPEGGERKRRRAERRAALAPVLQQPCEHRESRHRQRDPQKEAEDQEVRPGAGVGAVQPRRHGRPERERHGNARVRDGQRRPGLPAQVPRIDLEADQEHEQNDAELRDGPQVGHRLRRKQNRLRAGCKRPEHGRAEHDARGNLAHDCGLPQKALEERTDPPGGEGDCGDRHQQGRKGRSLLRPRRTRRPGESVRAPRGLRREPEGGDDPAGHGEQHPVQRGRPTRPVDGEGRVQGEYRRDAISARARPMPSVIRRRASSASPQRTIFTHLPGSRSL